MTDRELVRDVDLLCLDAGNTIVFLDHAACADVARAAGFAFTAEAFARAEGAAKRRLDGGEAAMAPPVPDPDVQPGWGAFMRTAVELAGVPRADSAACVVALWREHRAFNLWRRIPAGLLEAVGELRRAGVPVCVVSNSEGRLHTLFQQLGIESAFDLTIDSHVLGVEKPDPAIFRHALSHFSVHPSRALHVGDVVATDIVGARAAGVRAALLDPLGHYAGAHPDVARVESVAAVARAILAARSE